MDARRFTLAVALSFGTLAVAFALDENVVQAAVAGGASLVAVAVFWWYLAHGERRDA